MAVISVLFFVWLILGPVILLVLINIAS